jgi:branched-chain amino acid transport system substrate-binding protein
MRGTLGYALGGVLALGLAAAAPAQAADSGPITIGLTVPLSPPGDPVLGQLIRRGAEIGVDYVNNTKGGVLGGRKLQLVVIDTQGRNEAGVAAYRRLVQEEKAVAVAGEVHSSVGLAVNEVANSLGVANIATQAGAADITAKHYPIAFRTHTIDPLRAAAWLGFIKQKGWKKVSIVAETTDYGIGLIEETKKQSAAQGMGLDIQSITFDRSVTDLTPQLLQVKAFNPDLIINIGVGQLADIMIDEAATLGITPKAGMLISYDQPARVEFWKNHPKNGVGIYYTGFYSPAQKLSKAGEWLLEQYREKYKGEAATYPSLNGFGNIWIIAQALDAAKSDDPKALIQSLETGTFESWPDGPVTFPRADGPFWHNWAPPVLILQYTKPEQDWREAELVFPK